MSTDSQAALKRVQCTINYGIVGSNDISGTNTEMHLPLGLGLEPSP